MEDKEILKKKKKRFLILTIVFLLLAFLAVPVSCIIIFMTLPGDEVIDIIVEIDMYIILLSIVLAVFFFVFTLTVSSQIKMVKGTEARMVYTNMPEQTVQSNSFVPGETPHFYCSNCGQHIDISAHFCPFCGHKIEAEENDLTLVEKVHETGCLSYWSVFRVYFHIYLCAMIIGLCVIGGLSAFLYTESVSSMKSKVSWLILVIVITAAWISFFFIIPDTQRKNMNAAAKNNSDVYIYQDKLMSKLTPQLQARYGNMMLKISFNDVKKVYDYKDLYCFRTYPLMGVSHLIFIEKANIKNTATKQFLDRKRDEINARKRG